MPVRTTKPRHSKRSNKAPHAPQTSPERSHAPLARPGRAPTPTTEPGELRTAFDVERKRRFAGGIDWANVFWIAVLHLGLLAAPFTFTWEGLGLALFLGWATGGLGICLGYHRLFTHQSFKTYRPVRWFIAWLGGLAGEGSAVHWVANHRKHHALSDKVGDPHSPLDGAWWSHMVWLTPRMLREEYHEHNRRWAPDLVRDRMMVFLDRTFVLWHIGMSGVLFGLGYALGGSTTAWSFLVWGMFVRLVWVLHSTWFVNSATHMWGYRNYQTSDESRNLWWVALLTYGEGWHNNHHAYPRMARHGHRFWEVDVTFLTIRLLQRCGIVWDVVDEQHKKHADMHTVAA